MYSYPFQLFESLPFCHLTVCFCQATGAPTMLGGTVHNPSFVLIDVQGSLVDTYSYVLEGKVMQRVMSYA